MFLSFLFVFNGYLKNFSVFTNVNSKFTNVNFYFFRAIFIWKFTNVNQQKDSKIFL